MIMNRSKWEKKGKEAMRRYSREHKKEDGV